MSSFMPDFAVLLRCFAFVHAGACGSVAAPPSRAPGIAFLSRLRPRFAPGLCIPVAALPSARGWPCGSGGAVCRHSRRGLRFCCGVLPSFTPAVCLATNRTAYGSVARFAFVHAGVCGSGGAVCRHSRRGLRFYCGVLPSFTPVFFPLSGKKRRLAMPCVSIPPGRDRHSCVLAVLFGYLPLWVHFGFVRLFVAISTSYRGREE